VETKLENYGHVSEFSVVAFACFSDDLSYPHILIFGGTRGKSMASRCNFLLLLIFYF